VTADQDQPRPVSDIDTQVRAGLRQAHRLRWWVVGAVFLLLVAAVAILIILVAGQRAKAACETRYNTAFAGVQEVRTRLSNESSQAIETLIAQVFTPSPAGRTQAQDRAKLLGEYAAYQATIRQVNTARERNPLPALPRC
jgi:hypothetical protein